MVGGAPPRPALAHALSRSPPPPPPPPPLLLQLLMLTSDPGVMGPGMANGPLLTGACWAVAGGIIAINASTAYETGARGGGAGSLRARAFAPRGCPPTHTPTHPPTHPRTALARLPAGWLARAAFAGGVAAYAAFLIYLVMTPPREEGGALLLREDGEEGANGSGSGDGAAEAGGGLEAPLLAAGDERGAA